MHTYYVFRMPRYALTANFSNEEITDINNVKTKLGIKSNYKLLREAVLRLCREECKKNESTTREESQRADSRGNGEAERETRLVDDISEA